LRGVKTTRIKPSMCGNIFGSDTENGRLSPPTSEDRPGRRRYLCKLWRPFGAAFLLKAYPMYMSNRFSCKNIRHCLDNAKTMSSARMATKPGHTSFTITLPDEVIEMIMDLERSKIYGTNRAEIARSLILDMLKQLAAQNLVRLRGTQT
jgi:hypothetical protein